MDDIECRVGGIPEDLKKVDRVYRSGEVAQILHLSPRKINTLFDDGELEGYRISFQGNKHKGHRRFKHISLVTLMRKYGIPLDFLRDYLDREDKTL
jgi:hypothetical protein